MRQGTDKGCLLKAEMEDAEDALPGLTSCLGSLFCLFPVFAYVQPQSLQFLSCLLYLSFQIHFKYLPFERMLLFIILNYSPIPPSYLMNWEDFQYVVQELTKKSKVERELEKSIIFNKNFKKLNFKQNHTLIYYKTNV